MQGTRVERGSGLNVRGGNDSPATTIDGTGPPSSTFTKYRGIKSPEIAGSTGGFIGLIAGIAVVVLIGVFVGIYFYNRHRHRLPPSKRSLRSVLPSLSFTHPSSDPYAEPIPGLDDDAPTPRASGFGLGMGRPAYTRQRSSEWEMPYDAQSGNGKGKARDMGYGQLDMPAEPDEAAYPLRSRSPRPISPRIPSSEYLGSGKGKGKARSPNLSPQEGVVNPFESELDHGMLSPPIDGHAQVWRRDDQEDKRHTYPQPAGRAGMGDGGAGSDLEEGRERRDET